MPTRNINLTEHFDQFIAERIEAGRYKNASEIVRAGLALLERQEAEDELRLARLRQEVEAGFAAIERGQYTDVADDGLDAYFARLRKKHAPAAGTRRP